MKKLDLEQMEIVKAGGCGSSAAAVGLSVAAAFFIGGPIAAGIWAAAHLIAVYNMAEACG